ncbi:MAG: sulfotransferase domain-containing protein [Pseudolabrys sp.]
MTKLARKKDDQSQSGEAAQVPARAPIFNEPDYGGDRSYGLTWDAHPAAKIAIFGFPKSGNNWLKAVLTDYFQMPGINLFNQREARGIGLTHIPFSPEIEARTDFIHGVLIVRDLRDVVASFYHYSQTARYKNARRDFQYDSPEAFYYDWFLPITTHQFQINSFADDYARLSVPVLRYERMWDHPLDETRKLVLRWGMPFDVDRMKEAIKNNALENLKVSGKTFEIHIEASHFRRGGYGNYSEDLPPKIVADINERFRDLQRRWGYE